MEDKNDKNASIDVAETIDMMEQTQLCSHPIHHHSFSQINFLISGSIRVCGGCQQRLHNVFRYNENTKTQVVRCLACGIYAHRACAMTSDASKWREKCEVNSAKIQPNKKTTAVEGLSSSAHFKNAGTSNVVAEENLHEKIERTKDDKIEDESRKLKMIQDMEKEVTMVWTNDGPPDHWAKSQACLPESIDDNVERNKSKNNFDKPSTNEGKCEEDQRPMEIQQSTFANVASAIQEHLSALSGGRQSRHADVDANESDKEEAPRNMMALNHDEKDGKSESEERLLDNARAVPKVTEEKTALSNDMQDALLRVVQPEAPPGTTTSQLVKLASGTIKVAKTSSSLKQKVKVASVVGGIAGGVAGLAIAGPAGAILGVNCGKTAGVLGVVLEGSMAVGVLVAGAAAGSFTAQQIQQQAQQRIITIGADNSKRKILLVRPMVWIDPAWEQICLEAKKKAPVARSARLFDMLSSSSTNQVDISKKERYHRDSDIVLAAEFELATEEKILLLVSRILNDRQSLPGHVYGALITEYRKRSQERTLEDISNTIKEIESQMLRGDTCAIEEMEKNNSSIRARRLDTHAVIKHVTATLLEVRPGLSASASVTDMCATAVEGLVFGELYHSIFEEIIEEAKAVDEKLMRKITCFNKDALDWGEISRHALDALALIPESHTPVDKLRFAVQFLEHVSNHFTSSNRKAVSADSLLKVVCLHLVVANVPRINAEISFLEEFARDERLLRGIEGYALVTLQASLHFLNASEDFERDIFLVDD